MTLGHCGDLLWGPGGNNGAAARASFWPHINDPVRRLNDVKVVLDDDHRITLIYQPPEDDQQFPDVLKVQAGRRFVEHVDRASGRTFLQFGTQFHSLCLTTRQCWCRLAKTDVTQTDIDQRL